MACCSSMSKMCGVIVFYFCSRLKVMKRSPHCFSNSRMFGQLIVQGPHQELYTSTRDNISLFITFSAQSSSSRMWVNFTSYPVPLQSDKHPL